MLQQICDLPRSAIRSQMTFCLLHIAFYDLRPVVNNRLHTFDRIFTDIPRDRSAHKNIQHCEYDNLKCHDIGCDPVSYFFLLLHPFDNHAFLSICRFVSPDINPILYYNKKIVPGQFVSTSQSVYHFIPSLSKIVMQFLLFPMK